MNAFAALKNKKRTTALNIDVELLQIGSDPFTGKRSLAAGKYDALFNRLKAGQCIKCEPAETGTIATALKKWLERTGKADEFIVRIAQRYHTDGRGRVWMLDKQ